MLEDCKGRDYFGNSKYLFPSSYLLGLGTGLIGFGSFFFPTCSIVAASDFAASASFFMVAVASLTVLSIVSQAWGQYLARI